MRAERQAAASAVEARRQTAIAEAVNAFLNEDLLAVARPSAARGQGKDVTMREVLDVAAERIEDASKTGGRFAAEPLVEAQIRSTLGDTYRELGEYAAAEPHVRRALELRRGALGDEHDATVRMMSMLGLIHWRQGRLDEAEPLFQDAVEISRRVLGQDHDDDLVYEMNLANVHRAQGALPGGRATLRAHLETQVACARRRPSGHARHDGEFRQSLPGDRPLREGRGPSSSRTRDRGGASRARRRRAPCRR